MKAYEIQKDGGIENLVLAEKPKPVPGPNEILVRVEAVSLNYRDLMYVKGIFPSAARPLVPMSDGAGVVIAVGDAVTKFKIGDRVASLFFQDWTDGPISAEIMESALGGARQGMFAEYVALPEDGAIAVPETYSSAEAATLPCAALTAWNALFEHGPITAGETVVVQGTGGVSIFALQFAKLHGAKVIATSSSDEKLARARSLGADATINYKTTPEWGQAILDLTGGRGADHIIEVGGGGTLAQSLEAVRYGGSVSLIGVLTGTADTVNPLPVLLKSIDLRGIYVGSRAMFARMNRAIAANDVKPVIDRVFPFTEAREAFHHLENGRHFGKVVVTVG